MLIPRKITGQSVWNTRAVAELSLRKSHLWLRISVTRNGSQNSLNFVTYSTYSSNSICHFRGKMTTFFKLADKVAAFQAKLDLWGRRMNRGIFDSIQTLAGISEETEPEPSFTNKVVHDHLSLLFKEFKRYFQPQKIHELPRNGSTTHLPTNRGEIHRVCARRRATARDCKWRWTLSVMD